jgi:hypothetical protein
VSSKEAMFLQKMSKNLHISFAAMTHFAEGLCVNALLALKVENFSYLPCGHTNTNSVHDGMAINFTLEDINKK